MNLVYWLLVLKFNLLKNQIFSHKIIDIPLHVTLRIIHPEILIHFIGTKINSVGKSVYLNQDAIPQITNQTTKTHNRDPNKKIPLYILNPRNLSFYTLFIISQVSGSCCWATTSSSFKRGCTWKCAIRVLDPTVSVIVRGSPLPMISSQQ